MRIAVSAEDARGLESAVSAHFGRCPYYVLVDVQDEAIQATEVIANPFFGQHQPGQVPALIHEQRADVMLSGGMGGRAVAFFQRYGIEPVSGAVGSVGQAVAAYLSGELRGAPPCDESVAHGHS